MGTESHSRLTLTTGRIVDYRQLTMMSRSTRQQIRQLSSARATLQSRVLSATSGFTLFGSSFTSLGHFQTNAGTLTVSHGTLTGSGIQLKNSTLHLDGGGIKNALTLIDSDLALNGGSVTDVFVYGQNSKLGGTISHATTVYLTTNYDYHTKLTLTSDVVNHGTIVLNSSRNDRWSRMTTSTNTLTNAADGTIQVKPGGGGLAILLGQPDQPREHHGRSRDRPA